MVCTDEILDGSLCNVEITNLDGTFCDISTLHDGDEILVNYYNRIGYVFNYWKDENGDILDLEEVESEEEGKHSFRAEARCGGSFIAVFTPIKCAIKTLTNINGAGTQDGGGYYDYGNQATLKATVNNGYYFEGWYYNGYLVSTSYEFTLDVVDTADYTAYYSTRNYIVSATPNDSSLGSTTGSGEYEYLTSCTITATPVVGSYFVSWSDGDTNATRTFTVTGDMTVRAVFKAHSYTITVNKNVDACFADGSGEYAYNSIAALTARPANGYIFDHWETSDTPIVSNNFYYTFTVTRNITYTAIFRAVGYKVSVYTEPIEGGKVNGMSPYFVSVPPDTEVTLQPTPTTGYFYNGWSDGAQDLPADGTRSIIVKRDTTLTCLFDTPKYTLTIYVTPEDTGTVNGYTTYTKICHDGEVVDVTVESTNYYMVDHWSDGNTDSTRSITVTEDTTLTVTMKPIVASVTLYMDGPEGCLIEGGTTYTNTDVPIYEDLPLTLTIPEGCYFNYIEANTNIISFTLVSGTTYNLVVKGDVTVKLYFGVYYFNITASASPSAGGTVNGESIYSVMKGYGENVTLTATPATGYVFNGWSDGESSNPRTLTVYNDVNLLANFVQETDLHVMCKGGYQCYVNGVSSYNASIPVNTDIFLTITTSEGYFLDEVDYDEDVASFEHVSGSTYKVRAKDSMTEVNIELQFNPIDPILLTINTTVDGTASTTGGEVWIPDYDASGDYLFYGSQGVVYLPKNRTFTMKAVANSGYAFDKWEDNSTSNPRQVTYSADATVTAHFISN